MKISVLTKKELDVLFQEFEEYLKIFLASFIIKINNLQVDTATNLFKLFLLDYSRTFIKIVKESLKTVKSKKIEKRIKKINNILFALGSIYHNNELIEFTNKTNFNKFLKLTKNVSQEKIEIMDRYFFNNNLELINFNFIPLLKISLSLDHSLRESLNIKRWAPVSLRFKKDVTSNQFMIFSNAMASFTKFNQNQIMILKIISKILNIKIKPSEILYLKECFQYMPYKHKFFILLHELKNQIILKRKEMEKNNQDILKLPFSFVDTNNFDTNFKKNFLKKLLKDYNTILI